MTPYTREGEFGRVSSNLDMERHLVQQTVHKAAHDEFKRRERNGSSLLRVHAKAFIATRNTFLGLVGESMPIPARS